MPAISFGIHPLVEVELEPRPKIVTTVACALVTLALLAFPSSADGAQTVELTGFPSTLTTRSVQITVTGKVSVAGVASPGHDVRLAARRDGNLVSFQNVTTSQTGWFKATVATPRNTKIVATPNGGDPAAMVVTVKPVVRVSSPRPERLRVTTNHPAGQAFVLQRRNGATWVTAQRLYLPYPTAAVTRSVTAGTWRAQAVKNSRLSGATSKEIAIKERVSAQERVRRAVMAARAHHAIPSSLTPALDTLADDRADVGECYYGDPSPDILCRRGDPHATRTLVVLGDSHGRMWIPAFERIGRTKGWAAYYLVKPQCTAAHVLVGKLPGGEPWPECSDFHTWAAAKVAELEPELAVVATSLPGNGVYVDGKHVTDDAAVAAEYKKGMRRLFRALLPNAGRVVLLADVPQRQADPGPCLRNADNDLGDCLAVPNAQSAFITRKSIEAAGQVGVPVVDPTKWTCWDGVCPAVIGSTVSYRDRGHLTTTYARQLAEPVARALEIWH